MTLTPFKGRCHTCGHDHDDETQRWRDVLDLDRASSSQTLTASLAQLEAALRKAEAALSDIGDADREPGDDVAWCERRAAEPLPVIRAALAGFGGDTITHQLEAALREFSAAWHSCDYPRMHFADKAARALLAGIGT